MVNQSSARVISNEWLLLPKGRTRQPNNRWLSQLASQLPIPSASHTVSQSASHTVSQSATHTVSQSTTHTVSQSANQWRDPHTRNKWWQRGGKISVNEPSPLACLRWINNNSITTTRDEPVKTAGRKSTHAKASIQQRTCRIRGTSHATALAVHRHRQGARRGGGHQSNLTLRDRVAYAKVSNLRRSSGRRNYQACRHQRAAVHSSSCELLINWNQVELKVPDQGSPPL